MAKERQKSEEGPPDQSANAPRAGAPAVEHLGNLGRILHLLSEVVAQLEACKLGLTKDVEQLFREGLKTSLTLLDHCLVESSSQSQYDVLTRRMVDLLRLPTQETDGEKAASNDPDETTTDESGVILRTIEENGRYHLEIETVGEGTPGTSLGFTADAIQDALGFFDSIEGQGEDLGNEPETSGRDPDSNRNRHPSHSQLTLSRHESDQVLVLFLEIAKQFAAPLSRILGELFTGRASRQTVEGAVGIFRNVVNAANSLHLDDTAETASHLVDLFSAAEITAAPPTEVELKAISSYYDLLREEHPGVFPQPAWEPDRTDNRQERIDLDSIAVLEELKSIPGMGKKRIERLFAAGMSNLETLTRIPAADLQAVGGMGPSLAQRITASFRKYSTLGGNSGFEGPAPLDARSRRRLGLYLRILTKSQYHYRRAALEQDFGARADDDRRQNASIRRRTSSRILAFLAALSKTEAVCSFQKASYKKRIALLEKVLKS